MLFRSAMAISESNNIVHLLATARLSKIPFDCITIILSYLPLVHTVNAAIALADNVRDARSLINHRKSPIRLFSHLVPDPKALLCHMQEYRCVLSGSRASDYFRPGSCTHASDWDFFVSGESRTRGMSSALASLGVTWDDTSTFLGNTPYTAFANSVQTGVMTRGRGTGQKVQIVDVKCKHVIDALLPFHSTPVQCFLTHFGAVHLYGKLTAQSKTLVWKQTNEARLRLIEEQARDCMKHSAAIYISRDQLLLSFPLVLIEDAVSEVKSIRTRFCTEHNIDKSELTTAQDINEFTRYLDAIDTSKYRSTVMRAAVRPVTSSVSIGHLALLRSLVEAACGKCVCITDTTSIKLKNYSDRGYKEIDFVDYVKTRRGWYDPAYNSIFETYRTRHIGDSDTTVVPFTECTSVASHEQVDTFIANLKRYTWFECNGAAVSYENRYVVSENTGIPLEDVNLAMF